ncbi:hypothetical protein CYMTET_26646 [Cymbomonas tetramitiformis]|uniref:Sulfotransferase family protein n=1 Tax=Cymbomonas tetramitiformis TaxID=36881 RepID=A0AAE0FRD6_9CHLO|nr:hypothetical protein CYMTET_26646 [Cymbomonas tetramitiformis]|eukprot:gene15963-18926_t
MESLAREDFKSSKGYARLRKKFEASKGYMGHVYNIRRLYKNKKFRLSRQHPEQGGSRFFEKTYLNYEALYGEHVFVFTSVRNPVDHFVSSIRFFNSPHDEQDRTISHSQLAALLTEATEQPAFHNPLADDFGLSSESDVEWFITRYVRTCKVFFIHLRELQLGFKIAVHNITNGLYSTPDSPLPYSHKHKGNFEPVGKLLEKIKRATQLDQEIVAAIEEATLAGRCIFESP